jgi:hypothetical protein
MVANIVDEESSLSNYFEMLFKSETRVLIDWNVIINKELLLSSLVA